MTGPGKSPSWNGARIVAYWLGGTPPRNTSVSVPRLMPDRSVRTITSPRPGSGSAAGRISPRPGARSQNACASSSTSYASASYAIGRSTEGGPGRFSNSVRAPLYERQAAGGLPATAASSACADSGVR